MALNPVRFGQDVIEQFGRYLMTTFPIADQSMEEQVRRAMASDVGGRRLISRGPYVFLNRAFKPGPSLAELVSRHDRPVHPALPGLFPFIRALHAHQASALASISQGHHTIVATGTGSGKTEAFLLPIIDYCLRLRDSGAPQGVTALLVYPMNALADDQLRRLRAVLAGTGISFGRYTGATPDSAAPAEGVMQRAYTSAELKRLADGNDAGLPVPQEECFSRKAIREGQPRILVTNYSQLEYLLLRDKDLDLFRGAPLRYLVLDEVHTYTGALGSEVACLIRRLRHLTGKGTDELVCVGTSATVGSTAQGNGVPGGGTIDGTQAIRAFGARLFGVDLQTVKVVGEEYTRPAPGQAQMFEPPLPGDTRAALAMALEAAGQEAPGPAEDLDEGTTRAIEALCSCRYEPAINIDPPYANQRMQWAATLLLSNRLFRAIAAQFERPALLSDALESLRKTVRKDTASDELAAEVLAYLTLGARVTSQGEPLLRPKLHYFVQGFQGLTLSLDDQGEPSLHFDPSQAPPEGEPMRFPVYLCRSCGQHYLKVFSGPAVRPEGKASIRTIRVADRFGMPYPAETITYFTNRLVGQDDSAHATQNSAWICRFCGAIHSGQQGTTCHNEKCKRQRALVPVSLFQNEMITCHACGTVVKGYEEIVTDAQSSEVADITILAQTMLSTMPDPAMRKLLVFSDNRQDAAFQAAWMEDRSKRFRLRHLLFNLLETNPHRIFGLDSLTDELTAEGLQAGVLASPHFEREKNRKQVRWFLLEEFASSGQRRGSLESLALAAVEIAGIGPQDLPDLYSRWCSRLTASPEDLQSTIKLILDVYRRRGTLSDPLLCQYWSYTDEEVRSGLIRVREYHPTTMALALSQKRGYVKGWIASKGKSTAQNVLIAANPDLRRATPKLRNEFLEELWETLNKARVLIHCHLRRRFAGGPKLIDIPSDAAQINVDNIGIRRATHHYVCTACRRSQNVATLSLNCPEFACKGNLELRRRDPEHFDVHRFTRTDFVPLRPAEHSAQVSAHQRREIESEFKKDLEGKYNCLVCTPTLELGVDIGKLEMALLRNVPPTPSNYAQRAGRAGRRHRIAAVLTYCRPQSHDRYFFQRPEAMIAGHIRVPAFSMRNEPLVRKHVHSAILTSLRGSVNEQERALLELAFPNYIADYFSEQIVLSNGEQETVLLDAPRDISPLKEVCRAHRHTLLHALQQTFLTLWPEEEAQALGMNSEFLGRYVEQFAPDLARHVAKLFEQVRAYRNERDRLGRLELSGKQLEFDQRRERQRYDAAIRALQSRSGQENYTLSYLSVDGFFPGYAMARQSVEAVALDPFLELSRPSATALRELTPANFVYASKTVFRPHKFNFLRAGADRQDGQNQTFVRSLSFDAHSGRIWERRPGLSTEGGTSSTTVELSSVPLVAVELRSQQSINDTEKMRRRIAFRIVGDLLELHHGGQWGRLGLVEFNYLRRQSIRLVNLGPLRHGADLELYPFCLECGETRNTSQTPEGLERFAESHKKLHGKCTVGHYAMHVDLESDTLRIGPFAQQSQAVNLLESVRLGARHVLDMGEVELEGFLVSEEENRHWAVLYDPMPGGSGFLPLIIQYWASVAEAAVMALEGCASECEDACYSCLKHFRNQQWHPMLNRFQAMESMRELAHPLDLQHPIAPAAVSRTPDPDGADSEAELNFASVCKSHSFPIPPVQRLDIQLADGTKAQVDWAWPEKKILVFIDGTSHQLHGNPDQAKADRIKRAKCTAMGYKVVAISACDLKDQSAMTCHFAELAEYLDGTG